MKIIDVYANEILDSRGIPAIEASVVVENGLKQSAASATSHAVSNLGVVDVHDHDDKRYNGYGLLQAIASVEKIIKPQLVGMDCLLQQEIDKVLLALDGTPNKSKLGANTIISVSKAVAKAAAATEKIDLFKYLQTILHRDNVQGKIPIPSFTMIDGGKNANFMVDMQEFVVMPASFKTFHESLEMGINLHNALKAMLIKENLLPLVGEKGGFGPLLSTNEDALLLIKEATESLNIRIGYDVYLGIDVTANFFFKDKRYKIKDKSMSMSSSDLVAFFDELSKKYHILYLEDPMANDDIEGWQNLYKTLNQSSIIAGDYFTLTDPIRLQTVLAKETINAIVIKPSQIGTVTEALAVSEMARIAGLKLIVSDRTGETNDNFLADFAVAISADYVRFGAPVRGERVAKYNRLLEIERIITS